MALITSAESKRQRVHPGHNLSAALAAVKGDHRPMLAITVADGAIATFIDVDNTKCMTTIQLSTGQIGEWQPEGNDESAAAEYDTVLQELTMTEDGSTEPLVEESKEDAEEDAEVDAEVDAGK